MNRVNNPAKYLQNVLQEGMKYYIGFGKDQLTKVGKENSAIVNLLSNKAKSAIVSGKSGALKENTLGKYIRKQPEHKISVWKHIEYYSHHFGRQIMYDREFNIWDKELLYKYDMQLSIAKTPQGETIFYFPQLVMENNENHFFKAGAAMNMAIQLGGYFLFYDMAFEPIIPVTIVKDKSILPSGFNGSVAEKLDVIEQAMNEDNDPKDLHGNSYRFALLKEFAPDDVTMGIGGFNDYLMFEYRDRNLMVLENLRSGNATFLFDLSKFDKEKSLDKQTAKQDQSFLERIIHENMDDWSNKMGKYFK
ncbi:hypothetical protein ACFOW1_06965 [Parasediminibacterium paludis]|uniref:Uncharacterized protein n=1 Tax=Parasediminibacterium paludis TaxID=908966 RepID=A0ABV8PWV0_9BACT